MKRESDRQFRDKEDAGLEASEDVLLGGGDSFQARCVPPSPHRDCDQTNEARRLAQRDAARRRFEEKKQAGRMEKTSAQQERMNAMREKEKETMRRTFPQGSSMVFRRVSEDGEEGYPGRLLVEVLVGLLGPVGKQLDLESGVLLGSVVLVYRARLEEEGKVTPINLTQVRPSLVSFL